MLVYAIGQNENEALGMAMAISMREGIDLFMSPVCYYDGFQNDPEIPFDESIDHSKLEDGTVYYWVVDEEYVENIDPDVKEMWCHIHHQGDQVAVKLGGA